MMVKHMYGIDFCSEMFILRKFYVTKLLETHKATHWHASAMPSTWSYIILAGPLLVFNRCG